MQNGEKKVKAISFPEVKFKKEEVGLVFEELLGMTLSSCWSQNQETRFILLPQWCAQHLPQHRVCEERAHADKIQGTRALSRPTLEAAVNRGQ